MEILLSKQSRRSSSEAPGEGGNIPSLRAASIVIANSEVSEG